MTPIAAHSGAVSAENCVYTQFSETSAAGDDVVIRFAAEIGADKIQPTGSYQQEVTLTATTI